MVIALVGRPCLTSRFLPDGRGLDARVELVDGDFDLARERAAALARQHGIRPVEDSLDIETCEGAATIGLELVDTVPSFDAVLIALGNVDMDACHRWVGSGR